MRGGATAVAARIGPDLHVSYKGRVYVLSDRAPSRAKAPDAAASGELRAPMPGTVVEVLAREGDAVTRGQRLVVMEAMKTQQVLAAPFDGKVVTVGATAGAQVSEGQILAKVEPDA